MADASNSDSSLTSVLRGPVHYFLGDVPKKYRPHVAIAALVFIGGLAWVVEAGRDSKGPIVWLPAIALVGIALLIMLVVLFRVAIENSDENRRAIEDKLEQLSASPRWAPPALLIGLRFARQGVVCGAIELRGGTSGNLPASGNYEVLVAPVTRVFDMNADDETRLAAATDVITEVAAEAHRLRKAVPIEGVGFGVPGFVNLSEKKIERSMTGLADGTRLVAEVVNRLVSRPTTASVFGTAKASDLAEFFYLDNDVRCGSRHILSQHLDTPGWNDFVCLHIGTGVAAGIVMNRDIYYGPRSWAGELGHIDLSISPAVSLGVEDGRALPGMECSCGKRGFHFETLVNYHGLSALARLIDEEHYQAVTEAFREKTQPWTDEKILREGWPTAVASLGEGVALPARVRARVRESAEIADYLKSVLSTYTALVAGGVSTFVSLLDIEKVVFFGSLIELQHGQPRFDKALEAALARRLPRALSRDYSNVDDDVWQGAALLARDVSFHRVSGDSRTDDRAAVPARSEISLSDGLPEHSTRADASSGL